MIGRSVGLGLTSRSGSSLQMGGCTTSTSGRPMAHGCELDLLTDAQRTEVEQAKPRRNYFNCLDGPYGCELDLLTDAQRTEVEQAKPRRNYFNCLDGPYGCELDLLTDAQRTEVEQAELRRNYFNCLDGPHGCELDLLTDAQQAVVATARESRADSKAAKISCAENGSCYGDISEATGRPKTFTLAVTIGVTEHMSGAAIQLKCSSL